MRRIVAVCDPDREACEAFQSQFGGRIYDTYEEMLTDFDIEAVVIASPNANHSRQALLAMSTGKHVFVEQPLANSVAEAREMLTAAHVSGMLLMVGQNSRRNNAIRQLGAVIDQGILGRVLIGEGNFSSMLGFKLTDSDWRAHSRTNPGGPLMDLGIHVIDIFNYLFGRPQMVLAMNNRLTGELEIHDTSSILVRYDSGIQAYIGSTMVSPPTNYMRLYGTACNVVLSGKSGVVELHYPDGTVETPEITTPFSGLSDIPTQRQQLDEFAYCIRTGASPETDGWTGLFTLAIIEGALLSGSSGQLVYLDEFLKALDNHWSPGETGGAF